MWHSPAVKGRRDGHALLCEKGSDFAPLRNVVRSAGTLRGGVAVLLLIGPGVEGALFARASHPINGGLQVGAVMMPGPSLERQDRCWPG